MAKVFKISLCLQGTDKVFDEGFDPGEIANRTITIDQELTEKQMKSPMFLKMLIEQQDKMIEEQFKWKIERLDDV